MSIVVPKVAEVSIVNLILNQSLILKIYSNNHIPQKTDDVTAYTEISGGGYMAITLIFANWSVSTEGLATYPSQDFAFNGVIVAPGTTYGYYVVNGSNVVLWAERFPETILPFSPVLGSLIRINPRIQVQ